jgi:hypothetical protein
MRVSKPYPDQVEEHLPSALSAAAGAVTAVARITALAHAP